MTATPPPSGGSDPLAEVADWIAEKMPEATRAAGEGLARLASAVNKLAENVFSMLPNFKEK